MGIWRRRKARPTAKESSVDESLEGKAGLKKTTLNLHWYIGQILRDRYAVAVEESRDEVELHAQAAVLRLALERVREQLGKRLDALVVLQLVGMLRGQESAS